VLCAVVIVCDVVISVVGIAKFSTDRTADRAIPAHSPRASASVSPAGPVTAPRADARAVDWVVRELPRSAAVLADRTVSRALAAHGVQAVSTDTSAAFVVSTPALRAAAQDSPPIAHALAASVPVAVLGSGADAVILRQVTGVSAAQLAADARTRRSAESELLANPAITASPAAAQLFRAGAVDLRCATFLAIVAATDRVRIVRVVVDPAERAADRPARTVEVSTTSATPLTNLVRAASAEYRPASSTRLADGTWRLTWSVDVAPPSGP
jgi:hypothetical protein